MAIEYPELSFRFEIDWGGTRLGFTEVEGLENFKTEIVKYREGNMMNDFDLKRPGRRSYENNLTFKRGLLRGDSEFFLWLNTNNHGEVERRDMTIKLLNADNDPVVIWKAERCWPTSVTGSSLNSTSNEHFMESIEIAYESLIQEFTGA